MDNMFVESCCRLGFVRVALNNAFEQLSNQYMRSIRSALTVEFDCWEGRACQRVRLQSQACLLERPRLIQSSIITDCPSTTNAKVFEKAMKCQWRDNSIEEAQETADCLQKVPTHCQLIQSSHNTPRAVRRRMLINCDFKRVVLCSVQGFSDAACK